MLKHQTKHKARLVVIAVLLENDKVYHLKHYFDVLWVLLNELLTEYNVCVQTGCEVCEYLILL